MDQGIEQPNVNFNEYVMAAFKDPDTMHRYITHFYFLD